MELSSIYIFEENASKKLVERSAAITAESKIQ
jgi:hypothetical protein